MYSSFSVCWLGKSLLRAHSTLGPGPKDGRKESKQCEEKKQRKAKKLLLLLAWPIHPRMKERGRQRERNTYENDVIDFFNAVPSAICCCVRVL